MITFISYGATLVFYAAEFPRLARNTPHARKLRNRYETGEIEREEYELEESMEKNRISNISTASNNQPYVVLFDALRLVFYRPTAISAT